MVFNTRRIRLLLSVALFAVSEAFLRSNDRCFAVNNRLHVCNVRARNVLFEKINPSTSGGVENDDRPDDTATSSSSNGSVPLVEQQQQEIRDFGNVLEKEGNENNNNTNNNIIKQKEINNTNKMEQQMFQSSFQSSVVGLLEQNSRENDDNNNLNSNNPSLNNLGESIEIYKLKFTLREVKDELEYSNARAAAAEQQVANLNERVAELKEQRKWLTFQKNETEARMPKFHDPLEYFQKSKDQEKIDELNLSISDLDKQVLQLSNKLAASQVELEMTKELLKTERLKHKEEIGRLEKEIRARLEIEYDQKFEKEISGRLSESQAEATLEREILEAEFEESKANLEAKYEQEESMLLEEIAILTDELAGLEDKLAENEQNLNVMQDQMEDNCNLMNNLEIQNSLIQTELSSLKTAFTSMEAQKDEEIVELNQNLNELSSQLTQVSAEYEEAVQLLQKSKSQFTKARLILSAEMKIVNNLRGITDLETQSITELSSEKDIMINQLSSHLSSTKEELVRKERDLVEMEEFYEQRLEEMKLNMDNLRSTLMNEMTQVVTKAAKREEKLKMQQRIASKQQQQSERDLQRQRLTKQLVWDPLKRN